MIGVFDSGVGGLSVWREIASQLPQHTTVYVADQAHVPYGARPLEEVRRFSEGITRFLLDEGADVIVVACNAASAASLHHLRERFPNVPFVGMEPAVKPAAQNTSTGVVGVIATPATFQGELFASLLARFAGGVEVLTQVCPGLVDAIEEGAVSTPETREILRTCLQPLLEAGIDQLVLGCTHFPFVQPMIEEMVGEEVEVVDPAPAVARQTGRVLAQLGQRGTQGQTGSHLFCTTGDPDTFTALLEQLIGVREQTRKLTWREGELG
jgi:glutamate racemase